MCMVGDGDHDGVESLLLEKLAVIVVGLRRGVRLGGPAEALVVDVAQGDDVFARARDGLEVRRAGRRSRSRRYSSRSFGERLVATDVAAGNPEAGARPGRCFEERTAAGRTRSAWFHGRGSRCRVGVRGPAGMRRSISQRYSARQRAASVSIPDAHLVPVLAGVSARTTSGCVARSCCSVRSALQVRAPSPGDRVRRVDPGPGDPSIHARNHRRIDDHPLGLPRRPAVSFQAGNTPKPARAKGSARSRAPRRVRITSPADFGYQGGFVPV